MPAWQGSGFVSSLCEEPPTRYIETSRTLNDGTIAVTLTFAVSAQPPGSDSVLVGFTERYDLVPGESGASSALSGSETPMSLFRPRPAALSTRVGRWK